MDAKTGVERPPEDEKGGESTLNDHKPVAGGISDTSRKNNTEATQLGSELPRGNDGMAAQTNTVTGISSSLTSDVSKTPPDANVPSVVLGVKKLGTELIKKPAEFYPKEGMASKTDDSTVAEPKLAANPNVVAIADSGNDQVTIERTVAAQPLAQFSTASTQQASALPSLLSTAGETPIIEKTVSFSNNVDVAVGTIESKESGMPNTPGDLHPPPAIKPFVQMPLTPQTAALVPPTAKPPPCPLVSGAAEATSAIEPIANAPATSSEPSLEEKIRRLRAPLVDTYSPFIASNDTSLSAARERLQTALNQTRRLRVAFTDRVYQKYRVLLRPVQPSVDQMIERIKANPVEVSAKLQEEIRMIKKEKEIEKKEAQKLHAAVAANTAVDGTPGINTQETAEQLSWFGAGLNIVILPEEDIDDDIDIGEFQHRGPINPETGQRVSGISAAAAAAAEGLLDRVRRGGAMRMERQRRRQLQLLSGEDTEAEADGSSILSHLHLLSSSSIRAESTPSSITPSSGKSTKRGGGSSRGSTPQASSKASRGRSQVSLSGTNLLSLNPQAEELTPHGGTSTAATAALVSKGIGSAANSRTMQQRWRHPHPESHGGQRLALTTQSSSKKPDSAWAAVAPMAMSEYVALALPPLPTAKERREKKPVEVLDVDSAATERGRSAVQGVLEQFYCNGQERDSPLLLQPQESASQPDTPEEKEEGNKEENTIYGKETDTEIAVIEKQESVETRKPPADPMTQTKRTKRHVTEIGLLRGMQQIREQTEAKIFEVTPLASTDTSVAGEVSAVDRPAQTNERQPVDPIIAFSVLHALGLVHEVSKASEEQNQGFLSRVLQGIENRTSGPESKSEPSSAIYKDMDSDPHEPAPNADIRKLVSRKRIFSEAFSLSPFDGTRKKQAAEREPRKLDECMLDVEKLTPASMKSHSILVDSHNPLAPHSRSENRVSEEDQRKDVQKSEIAPIRGGGEAILGAVSVNMDMSEVVKGEKDMEMSEVKEGEKELNDHPSHQVVVPSIRGGGEALGDSSDESSRLSRAQEEPPASESAASAKTSPNPQALSAHEVEIEVRPSGAWGEQSVTGVTSRLTSLSRSISTPASFSPTRNATLHGLQMQRSHSSSPSRSMPHTMPGPHERYHQSRVPPVSLSHTALHHQAGASMSRPLAHGELPEYFSGMQPHAGFVAPQHEWSSLGAAAAGLLPTHSSLAALGLDQHRAAMVSLSVRERAARVLLAREQAAAAHRHAAAVRGGANVSSLSPQQAVVFMGPPSSHASNGLYHQATNPNATYSHLGPHPVASARGILSSPANSPLVGINAASPASGPPPRQQQEPRTSRLPQNPTSTTAAVVRKGNENDPESHDIEDIDLDSPIPGKQNGAPSDPANSRSTDASEGKPSSIQHLNKNFASSADEKEKAATPMRDPLWSRSQHNSNSLPAGIASSKIPMSTTAVEEGNTVEIAPFSVQDAEMCSSVATSPSDEQEGIPHSLITTGMRFFVPSRPPPLSKEMADSVVQSKIHIAYSALSNKKSSIPEESSSQQAASLIEYLLSVGGSVPIPKALVSNPLKERLNTPGFKNPGNGGAPTIPREVVVAAILVWLWAEHKDSFQRAFAKSGRIDVDPECKWLILAAIDAAVRALMLEIADSVARGGPLAAALSSNRNKSASGALKSSSANVENDGERLPGSFTKLDIQIASIVSEALMTELCINEEMDATLPHFEELVKQLDECRLSSLRAKSRERALLAALISRRATMSEPFSHAYVSSMVRSGEAIGHEELFEIIQDEETATSTKIPYDIFSDETGAWEDPCRVTTGFTPTLTGDDLTRRAHARAMIQKSLKKLQDRHNIRGGTPTAGPYTDPPPAADGSGTGGSPNGTSDAKSVPALQRTNSGLKRKASFSLGSDTPVPAGSGSASATSLALYRPNHHSAPLIWDSDALENLPYGRHAIGLRKRSLSLGRVGSGKALEGGGKSGKKARLSRSISVSLPSSPTSDDGSSNALGIKRSTEEINWTDVADIFQPVSMSGPSTPTARKASGHHAPAVIPGKTIIAPFCRRIENIPEDTSSDDGSEEDLSDAAVLERHRLVLEGMKTKLEKFMKARQNAQQRGARRSSSKPK